MAELPPGTILALGALLLAVTSGRLQAGISLLLPLASLYHLLQFEVGTQVSLSLFEYELTPVRIDRSSRWYSRMPGHDSPRRSCSIRRKPRPQ